MKQFDAERLNNIKLWMQRYVKEGKYSGSSVLIHSGTQEVFFHQAGCRHLDRNLPFARDTIARIYSMTKPVTSVALMMLVEKGQFSLNTPVSEFIPEFSDMHALIPGASALDQTEPCATPTLHQLMLHSSGLSYGFNPGLLPQVMEERKLSFHPTNGSLAETCAEIARLPLAFHPGTLWEYSVSLDVLGRVVEVASGLDLDQFFKTHIFEPLGMTETGFRADPAAGDRFASLYTPLDGDPMALNTRANKAPALNLIDSDADSPFLRTTNFSGGGGLVGTIDDYMNFTNMLRNGGRSGAGWLLSPATVDFMLRNHLPSDIAAMGPRSFAEQPMEGMGFGLGGAVVLEPGRSGVPGSVGDFSWGGMASTFFWIDRKHDISTVFFTQLSPSSSYPARAELKALVNSAIVH